MRLFWLFVCCVGAAIDCVGMLEAQLFGKYGSLDERAGLDESDMSCGVEKEDCSDYSNSVESSFANETE